MPRSQRGAYPLWCVRSHIHNTNLFRQPDITCSIGRQHYISHFNPSLLLAALFRPAFISMLSAFSISACFSAVSIPFFVTFFLPILPPNIKYWGVACRLQFNCCGVQTCIFNLEEKKFPWLLKKKTSSSLHHMRHPLKPVAMSGSGMGEVGWISLFNIMSTTPCLSLRYVSERYCRWTTWDWYLHRCTTSPICILYILSAFCCTHIYRTDFPRHSGMNYETCTR